MFGYVRPCTGELKVKEYDLYRAVYCGICRSLGGAAGCLARLTLSYDSVFLASLRFLAAGTAPEVREGRCPFHPLKKRPVAEDCDELRFAAAATVILADGKIRDDVKDEGGMKKLAAAAARPFVSGMAKKAVKRGGDVFRGMSEDVKKYVGELSDLEKDGCASLDETAERFGSLMSRVFSAGCEDGEKSRILAEAGRSAGRFVYAADAADDVLRDKKKKRYNPLLLSWGDRATETIYDGKKKREILARPVAEAVMTAAMLDLRRLPPAVELLCEGGDPGISAIVRNTVYLGMPDAMKRAVGNNTSPDPDKDTSLKESGTV